jgi:hypothetical protein
LGKPVVTGVDILNLNEIEAREAEARNDPGFRFTTNEEMLAVLGVIQPA